MLKKKIIASSISNLTDARYFAGWMVDYFVFNIDKESEFQITPQDIGTFQSWVEGPKYLLEMSSDQLDYCDKHLVDLNCQGVVIGTEDKVLISNSEIPIVLKLTLEEYRVMLSDGSTLPSVVVIEGIMSIKDTIEYFVETPRTVEIFLELNREDLSEDMLLNKAIDGFMVHGSAEEKVGFKSYDELDEIFEILQDF